MSTEPNTELDPFFRAAFSIDLALFTYHEGCLKILLRKMDDTFYKGNWGLIGQLISPTEDTESTLRSMSENVFGLESFYFKQLRAFTELGRHPQGRVITIAYYGLTSYDRVTLADGLDLRWFDIDDTPSLSYDHDKILSLAKHKLRKGLLRHPTVFELLPETFILRDVLDIYEQAFDRQLDAPNFRRQIMESDLVEPAGMMRESEGRRGRRPQYYRYLREKYDERRKKVKIGFNPIA